MKMEIHMSEKSLITDFLNTDFDLDWRGFLRGMAHVPPSEHVPPSVLDGFGASVVIGADVQLQDWVAGGLHGSSTPGIHPHHIASADGFSVAATDDESFPTSPPPGTNSQQSNSDAGGLILSDGSNDYITGMGGDDIITSIDALNTGEDWISAGSGNDAVLAGAGPDHIWGDEGDDNLLGEGGDDTIYGGLGNDTVGGGGGNDVISGGDGDDSLTGGPGDDLVVGGLGADTINGGDDDDSLYGDDIDGTTGAADVLTGGAGNDLLRGGVGDDTLQGGAGTDTLVGDAGSDRLVGGAGDDQLFGDDILGSLNDADTFVFANGWGHDRIYDFDDGLDKLDMTGVIGLLNFDQLVISSSGSDTLITFPLGGDSITLQGVTASTVDASDFIFLLS
jgi:Ca2+-binding RTX toxin-like protein